MQEALAALVACDTTIPPGSGYPAVCDLIERLFAPLGGRAERIRVPEELWTVPGLHGPRVNLVLRPDMGGRGGSPDGRHAEIASAMIYFHIDTAPVGEGWTKPALALTREGNRLYGRGTADMKGTIVAVRDCLLRLKESGLPLAYSPVLAFCTDEEGGRYPGIRYLAETTDLPDVLLNLNGSAEPRIWAGCVGSIDMMLTVTGRTAHSGEPDRGRNAIDMALPALNALNALKPTVEARTTPMPAPPWAAGPLHARLSLTAIHAGDKGSAIPGLCRITLNRRYLPEEREADVRAEIEATVAAALSHLAPEDWSLEETGHLPPVVDPDGPATRRWTLARAAAWGLPESAFRRYGSGTSSDFGWVQRAGQTHMLLGGLARPDRNVHAADEFTTTDDLADLSRAIENFLRADFDPEPGGDQPSAAQPGSAQP
ncbi:acetylornithine deacetylase [Acuticoccus sediminis]|uniref:Acetylornithine deacetylase n=1 Tax=Acuticoccus sediminis TaxID=2184697 RepID=A0A8B2NZI1_9HYPH|nr:M20 family metallopeptidase [Acuticoccus sediminis]RAI01970.1 acetylornithine deacetylase [Acuticoccus sediminis]